VVALLRPWNAAGGRQALALDILQPAGLALLALAVPFAFEYGPDGNGRVVVAVTHSIAIGVTILFALIDRPLRFALGLGVLLGAGPVVQAQMGFAGDYYRKNIISERSFFGVHRVMLQPAPVQAHILLHGTTVHGAQIWEPEVRPQPLAYYHPAGPLGAVFSSFPSSRFPRVGVVGLGTGATACYARPGQDWTFYEIDPTVVRIARDAHLFTFLRDCKPDANIVLGDARLSLQRVSDDRFDLLILDAFSSDAIPVHLLTAEAFRLYRRKLSRHGVLALHISNQFLDLEPIVGRLATETAFFGVVRDDSEPDETEMLESLRFQSVWATMARRPEDIAELAPDPRWRPLRASNATLWTDDHVNILGALKVDLALE